MYCDYSNSLILKNVDEFELVDFDTRNITTYLDVFCTHMVHQDFVQSHMT